MPYLEVRDRATLESRFVRTWDCERDDLTTSLPTIAEDGAILISVFDRDSQLHVQRFRPTGEAITEYDVMATAQVSGADVGNKVMLAPVLPAGDGTELFSYSYRQGREFYVSRQRGAEVLWHADVFLQAGDGYIALCSSPTDIQPELIDGTLYRGRQKIVVDAVRDSAHRRA